MYKREIANKPIDIKGEEREKCRHERERECEKATQTPPTRPLSGGGKRGKNWLIVSDHDGVRRGGRGGEGDARGGRGEGDCNDLVIYGLIISASHQRKCAGLVYHPGGKRRGSVRGELADSLLQVFGS